MNLVLFTNPRLARQPELHAVRDELAACPGTVVLPDALRLDVDSECYKGIRARIKPARREPGKMPPSLMEQQGPGLWRELHLVALAGIIDAAWLDRFTVRIPCGDCRAHWTELLKLHPGPYDFAWTVDRHNDVNLRIGKPVTGLDEVRRLYE